MFVIRQRSGASRPGSWWDDSTRTVDGDAGPAYVVVVAMVGTWTWPMMDFFSRDSSDSSFLLSVSLVNHYTILIQILAQRQMTLSNRT